MSVAFVFPQLPFTGTASSAGQPRWVGDEPRRQPLFARDVHDGIRDTAVRLFRRQATQASACSSRQPAVDVASTQSFGGRLRGATLLLAVAGRLRRRWRPFGTRVVKRPLGPARAASVSLAEAPADPALEEIRRLKELVAKYRAVDSKAWACLALTALLWSTGLVAVHLSGSHWAAVVYLALSISRCFMVMHDAAHLSFFTSMRMNKLLAEVSQYFVNYNWRQWASIHNSHHKHFGDETVKDTSLTIWFSEAELATFPWWKRAIHRFVHEPLWFYPLASLFVFFVNKPITHGMQRIVLPLLVWATLGTTTLKGYMVAVWIAGMIGVASFHLQHHCNTAYRVASPSERTSIDAALVGSTRIPIPFPLSLFSLGIEYHHLHHWDVRVPGYNLPTCDAEGEALGLWGGRVNTLGAGRAFKSLFHAQFSGSQKVTDERGNPPRFISFWPYTVLGLQDA
eukprot:TRINITY_DN121315_c0_g1_i1.p1 TRINITY_DN121315_c0_g1~~TRINITY_DN121315_c0_g1_i1.p1  ORF type:complete len:467 (-),score=54.28 TRINITY_DN121315_c0_g1_i1:48-1409(-)